MTTANLTSGRSRRLLNQFLGLVFCLVAGGLSAQDIITDNQQVVDFLEEQRDALLRDNRAVINANVYARIGLSKSNSSQIRFGLAGGISKGVGILDVTPFLFSYKLEIEAFRGGIGASLKASERSKFVVDIRNSIQGTIGGLENQKVTGRPLMKGVGSGIETVRDPFDYSFSLGTTFINGLNHKRNQQIGSIGGGALYGGVIYYNDGPPLLQLGLVDGYDRYYTGTIHFMYYNLSDRAFITDFTISYHRYTGWQPNLYELSGLLRLDYLSYKDTDQGFFNKGVWNYSIGFLNNTHLEWSIYAPKTSDLQDLIHYRFGMPYHPTPTDRMHALGAYYNVFGGYIIDGQ